MSQHLALTLPTETRQQLLDLTRKGNALARVQTRARILLLADKNQDSPIFVGMPPNRRQNLSQFRYEQGRTGFVRTWKKL